MTPNGGVLLYGLDIAMTAQARSGPSNPDLGHSDVAFPIAQGAA